MARAAVVTDEQGRPRHRPRRLVLAATALLVAWGLIGALAGLAVLGSGGEVGRLRVMTVLTGSMRPTLGVGDLVLAQVVPAKELRAGDIVTYRDTARDRYVTHRIQSIVWRGTLADIITRGDANETGENWTLLEDGKVGRVVLHAPLLGYGVGALGTTTGRIAVSGAALLLGTYAMLLIWRPRREDITARLVEELALLDAVGAPAPGPDDAAPSPDASATALAPVQVGPMVAPPAPQAERAPAPPADDPLVTTR